VYLITAVAAPQIIFAPRKATCTAIKLSGIDLGRGLLGIYIKDYMILSRITEHPYFGEFAAVKGKSVPFLKMI